MQYIYNTNVINNHMLNKSKYCSFFKSIQLQFMFDIYQQIQSKAPFFKILKEQIWKSSAFHKLSQFSLSTLALLLFRVNTKFFCEVYLVPPNMFFFFVFIKRFNVRIHDKECNSHKFQLLFVHSDKLILYSKEKKSAQTHVIHRHTH